MLRSLLPCTIAGLLAVVAVDGNPTRAMGPLKPRDGTSDFQVDIVQPDKGGQSEDDCGSGPINMDLGTWAGHGMDDLLNTFWSSGISGKKDTFDFHQAFALHCSQLQGSTEQKEQGWLFINAMIAIQDFFTQVSAASEIAMQQTEGLLPEMSATFFDGAAASESGARVGVNVAGIALSGLFGFLALPAQEILSAGASIILSTGVSTLTSALPGEVSALQNTAADPLAALQGAWPTITTTTLATIDAYQSAVLSNGLLSSGSDVRASLPQLLAGGNFVGYEQVVDTYDSQEPSLTNLTSNVMVAGLIAACYREINAFQIFIPGVVSDCPKWKKQTGQNQQYRLCRPEGMYILQAYDAQVIQPKKGMDAATISSFGNLGMDLQSLMTSSALQYQPKGIGPDNQGYDWSQWAQVYQSGQSNIWSQAGVFTVPVCELGGGNWRQSDNIGISNPPCDCKTATDKYGNRFIDSVTDDIKNWINNKC